MTNKSSKKFAGEIADSAKELKAEEIVMLDLSKISGFTDFFVVCSGTSTRHVCSIADRIIEDQKKLGSSPISIEGYDDGKWVLVDYGNVVVHVFYPEIREMYKIEKFWVGAPRFDVK